MKCWVLTLAVVVLEGALGVAAAAAEAGADELGQRVDRVFAAYDKPDTPGCALGVLRDGEFIYGKGYGLGSLELGVPLTAQSVFYLASVSKQFTAASVVLAAEQGYLSLDDDVRKYVPELPAYIRPISLRQMLHHTSGYRDVLSLLELSGRRLEDVHSTAEMLDLVVRQKALNHAPGDEYQYSNTNYWLMSLVIPRATGKSLAQFADENIFRPLGMTHTRFHDDRAVVVPGRVSAYGRFPVGGYRVDWSPNFEAIGDGGLMSSIDDLSLWDRNFNANQLGKGTLLQEMQTPGVLNNGRSVEYALGLEISSHRGLNIVRHGGAMFGYRTAFLRFPEQRLSVICLCNLSEIYARQLALQVAEIYLEDKLAAEPHAGTARKDLQALAGRYRAKASHAVVELAVADDVLTVDGQHFRSVTPGHFVAVSRDRLDFEFADGKPSALILSAVDATPERFERVPPFTLTRDDLARYAGDYHSSELQATYRLTVEHDKLMVAVNWLEPVGLDPIAHEEFRGPSGTSIVFRNDASGVIAGFDLFAWGIRDIAFMRAAPRQD